MTYQHIVTAQRRNNPCLVGLDRFLSEPDSERRSCRILSLDFHAGDKSRQPTYQRLDIDDVPSAVYFDKAEVKGRVLIVEDLNRDLVESLGTACNIDPLFFASHLHAPFRDMVAQTPNLAILPSRRRGQNFVNIHYHRTVELQGKLENLNRLVRDMNVSRKVSVLLPIEDRCIALVQHACSVLLSEQGKGDRGWLCIILVDAPIADDHLSLQSDDEKRSTRRANRVSSKLFLNGYEDFLEPPSLFPESKDSGWPPFRHGLLTDLPYYWERQPPDSFRSGNPTLLTLSYYPLKIIAAEWINYMAAMSYHIKRHEYAVEGIKGPFSELDRLNVDLRSLQIWRRRSLASQQKINAVKQFVQLRQRDEPNDLISDDSEGLLDDFTYLATSLDEYSRRLENMLPVVTSLVQISDSRRSFAESANVSRLTSLAFIFVPLTFTTGLFSMNTNNGPGGDSFWVFFVVAIPITLVVFLVARPPSRVLPWLYARFRPPRASHSPV